MKNISILPAVLVAAVFLLFSPATKAAPPCDCQRELQKLADARTDVERLEGQIAKMDGKIADAEGDAEHSRQEAATLQRQLQSTRDLIKRAQAKGAKVDTQDVRNALKDAERELTDALKDAESHRRAVDDLRRQRAALKDKLQQARAAAEAAERAYRACRSRCTGMKDDKKKPREIFLAMPLPGDIDLYFPHCVSCDKANDRLQEAKAAYAAAEKARDAARERLEKETENLEADEWEFDDLRRRLERADEHIRAVVEEFEPLGVDRDGYTQSRLFRQAEKELAAADRLLNKIDNDRYNSGLRVKEAKAAFDKAEKNLKAAEREMSDAARDLQRCNKSCADGERHSSSGFIPGVSFGVGFGMGGGGHHRRDDDFRRPEPRD